MLFEALSRVHWNVFLRWVNYEDYSWRLEPLNETLEYLCQKMHGLKDRTPPSDLQEKLEVIFVLLLLLITKSSLYENLKHPSNLSCLFSEIIRIGSLPYN